MHIQLLWYRCILLCTGLARLAVVSGCTDANIQERACSAQGTCPTGLACDPASNRCRRALQAAHPEEPTRGVVVERVVGRCGDGVLNQAEACDDGNTRAGDGCAANCRVEPMIAAGGAHTCVVFAGGNLRCWGWGKYGQLGYGNEHNLGDRYAPARAGDVDVGGPVIRVTAGAYHTCALLYSGTVRCWGSGRAGQLGYGNKQNMNAGITPARAGDVNVGGRVIQITAGNSHTCALLDTNNVRCWGSGSAGRLGYGNLYSIGADKTPAEAGDVDVGGPVVQISAGLRHTCALLDTGVVRCWGWGKYGQLGYGNKRDIGDDETPAQAGNVDVGGRVVQVAAGDVHTCALLEGGAVRCWGSGELGQLGYGDTRNIGDNETPAQASNVDVGGRAVQIAAGLAHTCALLADGAVRCWGQGVLGQLGYGNQQSIGDRLTPAQAGNVALGGRATRIAAGGGHTCALLDTGAVRCWGWGEEGQLGYGNTDNIGDSELPASAGNVPCE